MMTSEKRHEALVHLKQVVREHSPYFQAERVPYSLYSEGVPKGALIELQGRAGMGATEAVLEFLREHKSMKAAWIESNLTLYPTALHQRGLDPSRVLMVEAGDDLLWAALECLRSQLFGVLVLTDFPMNETDLRRLQMAAEKSGTTVFFLSHGAKVCELWPVSVKLRVQRERRSISLYQILDERSLKLSEKPLNGRDPVHQAV